MFKKAFNVIFGISGALAFYQILLTWSKTYLQQRGEIEKMTQYKNQLIDYNYVQNKETVKATVPTSEKMGQYMEY